jgi:hypothetical protein
MAGLWEYWTPKGESTLKPVVSCSIITTSANEDMSVLHDRMPVILPIEAWATWLSPTANATQCNALLKPLENGLLTKTCVSNKVNRPFPDNAECLQPVDPPEPLTVELYREFVETRPTDVIANIATFVDKNPSHASHQFPFCPALALPSDIVEVGGNPVAIQKQKQPRNSRLLF